MALSSDFKKTQPVEDMEEVLDALEKLLDRTKIMYEQYFMGIQKVAPMQLHRDVERKVRELTQQQIRNTGLRFRFTTMCQKFGAYNTYWKRTLREIEQGRYVRDLVRAKRRVDQSGDELPEELLVKLPKLVQDRIRRDRARLAKTRGDEADLAALERSPMAGSGPQARVHEISEEDTLFDDLDIDNLFGAIREQSVSEPLPVAPEPPPLAKPLEPPPLAKPPEPPPLAKPPEPPPLAKPPPRPIGPIVPASVTSKMKSLSQPAAPAGKAPSPLVPPPLKSAAPVPRPAAPPAPVPRPAAPPAPRPAAAPAPAASPAPRPAASSPLPPGMSEKQCRELHARYAKARQLVGDRTEVSYDKLLTTLNKQAPAIMKEHGARGVDFQVVVRGDKVILKAKPVK